jgi:hypothetical protein
MTATGRPSVTGRRLFASAVADEASAGAFAEVAEIVVSNRLAVNLARDLSAAFSVTVLASAFAVASLARLSHVANASPVVGPFAFWQEGLFPRVCGGFGAALPAKLIALGKCVVRFRLLAFLSCSTDAPSDSSGGFRVVEGRPFGSPLARPYLPSLFCGVHCSVPANDGEEELASRRGGRP